jgi:hypothetical protein
VALAGATGAEKERVFALADEFSYLVGRFSGVHVWPVLGVPEENQASGRVLWQWI